MGLFNHWNPFFDHASLSVYVISFRLDNVNTTWLSFDSQAVKGYTPQGSESGQFPAGEPSVLSFRQVMYLFARAVKFFGRGRCCLP